ncbi:MAG: SDR family NAD(P)-dependent oxidoreductase [Reichenbachiella sp.]
MKKIALVTGATSGIGEAIARELAPNHSLIICGRRKDRLDSLSKELSEITEIQSLQFDVSDEEAVNQKIASLPNGWKNINVLINNAGNAHGRSPLHAGDSADWEAMIDSNLKGVLYVSKAVIPGMTERKSGDIINIGSIAGKQAYANGNVYCATKYAIDGLTQSLRYELLPYQIRVMAINPGLVETEFSMVRFKGDKKVADSVYEGLTPLSAKDIAEVVKFSVDRPSHVVLTDITILAAAQGDATTVNRTKP